MTTQFVTDWRRAAQLLIETNDLDPMYAVIKQIREDYDDEWYYQFLMHYTMFYDPRGAIQAIDVDQDDFWPWVMNQAMDPSVKRGPERRHFRAGLAQKSILNLRSRGTPVQIFNSMYAKTYTELARNIEHKFNACNIGPYFAWKIMDFFNVCSFRPVSLSYEEAKKHMPKQPCEAIEELLGGWQKAIEVNELVQQFPHPVRPGHCDWAETETVLCNLKGLFLTGTVWIGRDIAEYKEVLKGTGYDRYLPPEVDRGKYMCQRQPHTFVV